MKKLGIAFYLTAASALLIVAGYIAAFVSHGVAENEYSDAITIFVLGAIAIVTTIFCTVTTAKAGKHAAVTYILGLIGMIAVGASIGLIVFERAYLASALFTWDSYNTNGWSAFYTSIASVVLYLLGATLLTASGFCKGKEIENI